MNQSTHETDIHDLALGVIHALKMVDVKAMSYVQLRRLFAALTHVGGEVSKEMEVRSGGEKLGDTAEFKARTRSQ